MSNGKTSPKHLSKYRPKTVQYGKLKAPERVLGKVKMNITNFFETKCRDNGEKYTVLRGDRPDLVFGMVAIVNDAVDNNYREDES